MALPSLGFWALFRRSPSLRRLIAATPTEQLIALQVFRVGGVVFLGLLATSPDPVLIGRHPLALLSLFQVPLAIILHVLVLRRLFARPVAATLPQTQATLP